MYGDLSHSSFVKWAPWKWRRVKVDICTKTYYYQAVHVVLQACKKNGAICKHKQTTTCVPCGPNFDWKGPRQTQTHGHDTSMQEDASCIGLYHNHLVFWVQRCFNVWSFNLKMGFLFYHFITIETNFWTLKLMKYYSISQQLFGRCTHVNEDDWFVKLKLICFIQSTLHSFIPAFVGWCCYLDIYQTDPGAQINCIPMLVLFSNLHNKLDR